MDGEVSCPTEATSLAHEPHETGRKEGRRVVDKRLGRKATVWLIQQLFFSGSDMIKN